MAGSDATETALNAIHNIYTNTQYNITQMNEDVVKRHMVGLVGRTRTHEAVFFSSLFAGVSGAFSKYFPHKSSATGRVVRTAASPVPSFIRALRHQVNEARSVGCGAAVANTRA